jgi:hypothetical protein
VVPGFTSSQVPITELISSALDATNWAPPGP